MPAGITTRTRHRRGGRKIIRSVPDQFGGADLADRVLFVDAEAIVIDKPAGLAVDPPKRRGDSLAARIDELKLGFQRPPVPVHRLDRDTSGCLLLARNPKARARFGTAFERGEVEKIYVAVVEGYLQGEGAIDLALAKISSCELGWRMVADESGKPARTNWRVLRAGSGRSLVEFRPETGRTHQIRAHAQYGLGAPVVGDPVYGRGGEPMLLHALRIVVPRAPKPAVDVTAPLPPTFGEWRDAT